MTNTNIVVNCPVCSESIAICMLLIVDTMPTPYQDWRGLVTVDNAPIKAHLLTHFVATPANSTPTKVSSK